MSKKNKNRHKKHQVAKVIQESIASTGTEEIVDMPEKNEVVNTAPNKAVGKPVLENKNSLLPEVTRVRKDIKKIGLVMGSILVCLIIATIADGKTDWVLKLSDTIFKNMPH